jgi:tetratricopeptide (TPR) repeat protein
MGTVDRGAGDFGKALEQLEEGMATASTPEERAQVYAALEAYYLTRGQVGRTIEYMEQRLAEAQDYLPVFVAAQHRLVGAGTYAEAGREEDAFALVAEAGSQLAPPFDGMTPIGELEIHLALEDPDAIEATLPGVEAFITALQYEILRPALVRAQGTVHELRGEYREAIGLYEEERRLSPSSTTVPMRLGRCYRGLGEYEEAVSLLQESLQASPFGPRVNYELALTYEAMGRLEDARTHLTRALEVWREADSTYKWAQRAREAAERIGG